jgi:hypothetical protein
LPDLFFAERIATAGRREALFIQDCCDLGCSPPRSPKFRHALAQLIAARHSLVGADRANQFLLAGKSLMPMNGDIHTLAVRSHAHDHAIHQAPNDLLAIGVACLLSIPEGREVLRQRGDSLPLVF